MTNDLPVISSFWTGPRLSYLEQLCLKSFADNGHRVRLYTYEDDLNIPKGVELVDAREIMPEFSGYYHKVKQSPATGSDKFRYHLLSRTDEIWVDCDALCIKPFPDTPYIFAKDHPIFIANGVLRLPQDSPTLKNLIDFCENDTPLLPDDWIFAPRHPKEEIMHPDNNGKTHVNDLPWGIWGPQALTYFLKKNDEAKHLWRAKTLYPLGGHRTKSLLRNQYNADHILTDQVYSVHLFGSKIRRILIENPRFPRNVPKRNSYVFKMLRKHGINPYSAPLVVD